MKVIKEKNEWILKEIKKEMSKKDQLFVDNFIKYVKKMIGIDIEQDTSFKTISRKGGKKSFYVDLGERQQFSQKFNSLQRLSNQYGGFEINPSGVTRYIISIPKDSKLFI